MRKISWTMHWRNGQREQQRSPHMGPPSRSSAYYGTAEPQLGIHPAKTKTPLQSILGFVPHQQPTGQRDRRGSHKWAPRAPAQPTTWDSRAPARHTPYQRIQCAYRWWELTYILIASAMVSKILTNSFSSISSKVIRNPCNSVANEESGTTQIPVAASR